MHYGGIRRARLRSARPPRRPTPSLRAGPRGLPGLRSQPGAKASVRLLRRPPGGDAEAFGRRDQRPTDRSRAGAHRLRPSRRTPAAWPAPARATVSFRLSAKACSSRISPDRRPAWTRSLAPASRAMSRSTRRSYGRRSRTGRPAPRPGGAVGGPCEHARANLRRQRRLPGEQNLFLGPERVEEAPPRDACRLGDRLDRDGVEALIEETPDRARGDPLCGRPPFAIPPGCPLPNPFSVARIRQPRLSAGCPRTRRTTNTQGPPARAALDLNTGRY